MALIRKSSLDQLKKLRGEVNKAGGDIADKVAKGSRRKENKMANSIWMDNPVDRQVDTINQHIHIENENRVVPFSEFKQVNEDVSVFTEGPDVDKSPQDIMRDMNNVKNWSTWVNLNNTRQNRDISAGKYINVGEIKGYVNRIEGNKIFIETLNGDKNPIKEYNIKEVFKKQKDDKIELEKPEKAKPTKVDSKVYGGNILQKKEHLLLMIKLQRKFIFKNFLM
jgi:hypothetical protein